MTVDVDGWASLLRFYRINLNPLAADVQVNVEIGVNRLLNLFETHNLVATFFVTGEMALLHPGMVRLIYNKGHEVACHGLYHQKGECLLERIEQEHRIKKATNIIEKLISVRPIGFRAPCLNANSDTFKILLENHYLYDSSIISTFIPGYYGYPVSKLKPYRLSLAASKRNCKTLWEIPVAVNPLLRVPISAAWMRNLGTNWVKLGIKMNFQLGNPVVFYIHPRDVLPLPIVKGVPWHVYNNVGVRTIRMLEEIIKYVKNLNGSFLRAADLALILDKGEKCWSP
jgi:peptidoglycan/xylan/chitin deacetylase (PgdA/CDA1 family)